MRKLFLLLYATALFQISCKENKASESVSVSEIKLMAPAKANVPYDDHEIVDSASVGSAAPASQQTKIIKNAHLSFESSNLNESFQNIQKAVQDYKAIIQTDESGKNNYSVYRNLTIRIPNQHFDTFIENISKGITHFDRKEISQQDVTEEFIDIQSRMNTKKKLEQRYLQLLSKANKVSEMLEIEKQLAEIREEIEAKEGQLKYMQNKVSLSTISIEMYTNNASESGATVSYGSKIWNAIKEGFNGLSNFMLGVISIWPFILIFVGIFLLIKRRFFKKKA